METFRDYFNIILSGNEDESRNAAREVRKFLYSSKNGEKYKEIARIVDEAPMVYQKIQEDQRQENFVMAISVIYFLRNKDRFPDFLFPWFFHLIQHKNGYIRHAAVRMFENELGPLTYHLRCPNESPLHEFTTEQADAILFGMYSNLNMLLNDLWEPKYKKYKYIDSLPSSPYKSVQMIINELEEDCGDKYVAQLENQFKLTKWII